ncbi:hypothetical protein [Gorillibacterium sp. sgz5001074]|uniref:hypothetical protein n=1 Tax=Gorillibacterium sp. sgz5001074 TaxID=3446695 RepID=UPI003F66FA5F
MKVSEVAANELNSTLSLRAWGTVTYNPMVFGAIGNGIFNDSIGIQLAIDFAQAAGGGVVTCPPGTYLLKNKVTIKEKVTLELTDGATLKRGVAGPILNIQKRANLRGGSVDCNGSTYTGSVVEFTDGENAPGLQGLQQIENVYFYNIDSYAIDYSTSKGFLSKVIRCAFIPLNNTATAIRWPDEPVAGGNRSILDCYSACPILESLGCDNGVIRGNVVGIQVGDTRASVIMSTNDKKMIIQGNRFAHGTNVWTVMGGDHVIADNVIASAVAFDSGCNNVKYDSTNTDSGFSGTVPFAKNFISTKGQEISYTPTWTAATTAPSFGNADVRCRYLVEGRTCTVRGYISFGSTTTFGSGMWQFSIPIASVTTTTFSGSAMVGDRSGTVTCNPGSGKFQFYIPAGGVASATSPFAWASGNILIFEFEYNLA